MTGVPLLVLRPEPGNAATVAAARERGLTAIAAPLFRIEPVPWTLPDPTGFDAVLLGSANAVRHGGPDVAALTVLPAYAVGEATAQAAREAGFTVAGAGSGGLEQVAPQLTRDGRCRVLRLAGAEHVPFEAPPGVIVEALVVYEARPLPLADEACAAARRGAVVLLHSAAAARRLAQVCESERIARDRLALACLGPRIAEAAGPGWKRVRSAARPDDAALLALAAEMCQSR